MDIATLAAGMRARMPFDVGKLVLTQIGLPKGHGWEGTVDKLRDLSTEQGDLALPQLLSALAEHTICGEKLVAMYKVTATEKSKLRKALKDMDVPQGKFTKAYPGVLSQDDLDEAAVGRLHLVAVSDHEGGLAAVFTSIRFVEVRETVLPTELPKAAAQQLADYKEMVGIKQIKVQAMDVVWIPDDGDYVDIRVDHPGHLPEALGYAAQKRLHEHLQFICAADYLDRDVNFFPLIQKLYATPAEGRVVEMAFGTTTASIKHERMRRKNNCLRTETYHKGGKAALNTPLEMYRLSVQWDIPLGGKDSSKPEVSFNGSSRLAGTATPEMREIVISGCLGISDFNIVRGKIESYLVQAAKEK